MVWPALPDGWKGTVPFVRWWSIEVYGEVVARRWKRIGAYQPMEVGQCVDDA